MAHFFFFPLKKNHFLEIKNGVHHPEHPNWEINGVLIPS